MTRKDRKDEAMAVSNLSDQRGFSLMTIKHKCVEMSLFPIHCTP